MILNLLNMLAESFDLPILEWIAANLRSPIGDKIWPIVTLFGEGGIFWIACAVLMLCFRKTRKTGFSMAVALILGVLVCNVTMKPLIGRIRPYDYQLQHFGKEITLLIAKQHDFSFPSGHTIASFEAAAALLCYKKRFGIPALILACLVAFSRLYLYVHYPTDVIFSVIVGTLFGLLGTAIVSGIYKKFVRKGKFEKR